MKLSRALAVAANRVEVQPARLRAIALALAAEQRRSPKPGRPDARTVGGMPSAGNPPQDGPQGRQSNLHAMQSSRSLLVRTIAILK